ncbi:MAG: hypothetical protein JWO06_2468 [Bacteroidota bacterium]|nr:hypothetical protein [Bacteroidota bacterium]
MSSVDIKNTYASVGEVDVSIPPSALVLKLAVTQRSVRYFIQSVSHGQIIFYGEHTLHHVDGDAALVQRLERIVEKDEALQLAFGAVFIGVNPAYTLLPQGFFLPGADSAGIAMNQTIDSAALDIVFDVDTMLYYKLKSSFPNATLLHLNSSFLNGLPAYLSSDKLFVNLDLQNFDVIRFNESGQLQLMNRYQYQTETDFAYFLLLCCEELKIDREKTELVLLGEVDARSKIYDICYRYFRTTSFISPPANIAFTKSFELFPKHLHFNLYTLSK